MVLRHSCPLHHLQGTGTEDSSNAPGLQDLPLGQRFGIGLGRACEDRAAAGV